MKKAASVFLGILFLSGFTTTGFAKDKDKDAQPAAAAPTAQDAEANRRRLIQNVQALQNQEARILVLTQMVSQEVASLRQMEAVFCDQYSLDVNKWRNGLYRLDQNTGKFSEVSPQEAKAALKAEAKP